MGDCFASILAIIEDNPETRFGNAKVFGNFCGREKKMADEHAIVRGGGSDAGNRLFGNDENVDGGPGLNVPDGKTQIVLVKKLGRNFPRSNFFKKRHRSQVSCK